jgi:signal transduction histidine kinase
MDSLPDQAAELLGTGPFVQTILAELQVVVVCSDAQLQVVAHTPAHDSHFSELKGDSVGKSLTTLFPELIGAEEALTAVALGRATRFELPMINREGPDKDRRYLTLTAFPHPVVTEQMVVLVCDVTAEGCLRRQAMQRLNETRLLRARLEEANRTLVRLDAEKSAFLLLAAHDLRAPLTVIRSYVEAVIEAVGSDAGGEVANDLNLVLARTRQMADLIDNLLDVERIESGTVAWNWQLVDLAVLVQEVGQDFAAVARQQGVNLRWHIPAALPRPKADRVRLVQVLNNLLSNACKFTPAGGRIDIEVLAQGPTVAVEVTDTGPGISEEDQARLFERFFRTHAVRMQRIPGSGLGLPIVRAIVERHGGQVYCRSRLEAGSTFGFTLPVVEA